MTTPRTYPAWRCSYSNEGFDRTQSLASQITEEDRRAGRDAPPFGYSDTAWEEAERLVRAAQRLPTTPRPGCPGLDANSLAPGPGRTDASHHHPRRP